MMPLLGGLLNRLWALLDSVLDGLGGNVGRFVG